MRAEQSLPDKARDVFKVSQWKHDVDTSEKWWRRLFFKCAFLPFLNLSFKLGIPAVKEVLVESDEHGHTRRTFRWFEDQGIFDNEEQADAGCLTERWGYCKLPYGRLMPSDSAQYSGTIFPRRKNPRKWAKPTLSLVIKDRIEQETIEREYRQSLQKLSQVLDQ